MSEIRLFSAEDLAELDRMAEEMAESGRQYDAWCARHNYRRNSFAPGAMDRMYEADHAEALAEDRERAGVVA